MRVIQSRLRTFDRELSALITAVFGSVMQTYVSLLPQASMGIALDLKASSGLGQQVCGLKS